ncbi:MAG TPA: MarR family transcriptional regulator [Bacillota bacterium]|nr:MarR family transcriptional regulator [Bacillota bacterium]HPZ90983.1 MarR family transcriptional regulator [Bacillota bacterium]HQE02158.1 MarR family transcriptional regulator [Bacillota bacterium]
MASIRDVWVHANCIIHSARQILNDRLRPLGLTSAEGNILLHLLTRPRSLRQEEISGELEISKAAVSRALDSLESKGLIVREKDESDRRASLVCLTARARSMADSIEAIYNDLFAIAAQGIEPQDIEAAVQFFAVIAENFARTRTRGKEGAK